MLTKELANTGVQIPEVGLGTWHYHAGPEPLQQGLDAGGLFIDTAESYGTEPVVAQAIARRRGDVFLASKVSAHHLRRADLLQAADESLRRLRTDYLDLYQLHNPNETVPLEETLAAMEELVDAGKVRFLGVCNFSLEQLRRAQRALRKHPLVSNQVRYNLIDRTIEQGLLAYCQANRITIIAYSPLARGFQHIRDNDPRGLLETLTQATGRTPVQVALNWCLCRQDVVVIPKGNSAAHVLENCGASGWRLQPEQVRALDEGLSFRCRSGAEAFLRAHVPPGVKAALLALARLSPRPLRRFIH